MAKSKKESMYVSQISETIAKDIKHRAIDEKKTIGEIIEDLWKNQKKLKNKKG